MLKIGGGAALIVAIVAVFVIATQALDPDLEALEHEGREYIMQLNKADGFRRNRAGLAEWAYTSNITKENEEKKIQVQLEISKQEKMAREDTKMYKWQDFQDFSLRRMFEKYSQLGVSALPEDKYKLLIKTKSDMESNYATSKICSFKNATKCDLSFEPDVTEIFAASQDPEELKHTWVEWHKAAGARSRQNFTQYVQLDNEAAKLNNFKNVADWWLSEYEVPDFEEQLAKLWEDVKPLYQQLHAYVRKRLRDKYGDKYVSARGPIPAHLLGNIWTATWSNIESFTRPYPDKKELDITQAMKEQNYTAIKMFQMSDEFFRSLNLTAMPELFWKNSIIEKPDDRDMVCHPSAWDFFDGQDFRIKQCTTIDYEYFKSTHHEMGHIQYFLQYRNQPIIFRGGANPGFHEAVGDTIALSVSSPKHLRRVGLYKGDTENYQTEINQLYKMGIEKIAFLPFAYSLDLFRYGVFRGTTAPEDYTCHFWHLREMLQGVEPPVNRTEDDFDAAALYHVSADVEFARYYVSFIVQFQFHRALCQLAGEYIPGDLTKKLVDCDIYQSVSAGNALANMLKMGSSKPWPDAMEALTGQRAMKADGLLEYFRPLHDWLVTENTRTGEFIGWEPSKIKYCSADQKAALLYYKRGRNKTRADPDLEALEHAGREYITQLNKAEGFRRNRAGLAEWAYTSNITKENEENMNQVELEISKQKKVAWEVTKMYKWQDFQDFGLRRMFKKYSQLGESALPDDKYKLLIKTISDMELNYATSKICSFKNATKCDLSLEPDVTEIFTKSQDPEELKHTWVEWHKAAGARSRQNFTQYVQIDNEAAKLNNFKNVADWWLSQYEVPDFEEQLAKIWEDVKPLYQQLHAYVRKRLRDKYGDQYVSARGPIPAHLLGNTWTEKWSNIESFTRPYPDKKEIDITQAMKEQNYTAMKMFQMSDEFFRSLNLTAMPELFWNNSIIEKPDDRDMMCHLPAWDFFDGQDFRIQQCTAIDYEYFKKTHHEMGHIQYYLQYRNQPIIFRDGANPGFHEAVGDTIALSVSSPKHLRRVGLYKGETEDDQTEINQLYKMGIEKIVFLPFAYSLDLFRYGVYRGTTAPEDYNCHFWHLREMLQGVEPPVNRTEDDFDAAAIYHVWADVEYARNFVSLIVQFQFHRALCQLAGEYIPEDLTKKLVDCDIYQSVSAGNALAKMLKMGSSKPWPDAMEALTGQRAMKADGLLEYFRPLYDWLVTENNRTGEFIGWEPSKIQYCSADQKAALLYHKREALERAGREYIMQLNKADGFRKNRVVLANWAFSSNITMENAMNMIQVQSEILKQEKMAWEETKMYKWQNFQDFGLRRMFEKYSQPGVSALPDEKSKLLIQAVSGMESNYATSKICSFKNTTKCDLSLEPDITEIFAESQDPEELKHTWVEWHKAAGARSRQNFTQYVQIENEAAKLNNFKNVADWWLSQYEVPDFEEQLAKLWEDVKPFYQQLHAYVRKRLRDKYGDQYVSARGPIPAHLLGNIRTQTWSNIESFTRPYPDKKEIDITQAMKEQNYTAMKMFQMSDEFFRSLNLTAMPELFWKNSIIEKPDDRDIACNPSAWDFYDGQDFRIQQCTAIDYKHFQTTHLAMVYIQYCLQYRNQPIIFRDGANPGFHDAVGNTIALSVSSPKHLKRVGLYKGDAEDDQTEINQLYKMGIDKIVFFSFAYTLDLFRYGVFRGTTAPEDYNCHFWHLREMLQGVEPPVNRTEDDFDAAAIHVWTDTEYARNYVPFILQFQFHRALCQLAGEYIPGDLTKKLVDCDIYQSVSAGNALANMLKMGSSKPWPDAMEALTGQRAMKADGLLEYFRSMHDWLVTENNRTGEFIGWEPSKIQYCSADQKAALLYHKQEALERAGREYITQLDKAEGFRRNRAVLAEWAYSSNITEENNKNMNQVQLEISKQEKMAWEDTKMYKWQDFQDFSLRRMFMKYSQLGVSALPVNKYELFFETISDMESNYATSKICSFKNATKCDLPLEPNVTEIFTESQDPEELKHTWVEWHKAAYARSRQNFTQFVQLQNEAAKLNNFKNIAHMWLSQYEVPDFEEQLAKLWEDVKPLYQQLHAYVRKRLRDKYGDQYVSARGPIPAHLLGNIRTQTWSNIESFTRPYPDKKEIDITQAMKEQNYTAIKIFQMSDEFFRSLNLTAMPELFWKNSIIEKPVDRDIMCDPLAWDFFDGQDFRIKQCTTIDYEYFQTTHLRMGHIQYYLQYRNQPIIFRDVASPGFHEAVGDTIVLSVSSPKHLKRVGLYKEDAEDDQTEINQLYKMAIEKIVSLPFAYSLELFRYGVFRGTTAPEDYNCHFWHLREMQGVEPPVNRTEDDFDAGAIHVWADAEYFRYFVSFILQFQFHHALCQLAGEYIPGDLTKKLVDCDIYQSVSAGNALANMLKMGSSKPWPDAMEALTGQRAMKADGLLEYFRPLYDWLVTENNRTGEYIGWEPSKIQYCSADQKAALLYHKREALERAGREYITQLNKADGFRRNRAGLAEWAYTSNITEENKKNMIQVQLETLKQEKMAWEDTKMYKWQDFQDFSLRRMFMKYSQLGVSALPVNKYKLLFETILEMKLNYATSKICSFKNATKCDLPLKPNVTEIFTESQDPEELKHTWVEWHKVACARSRQNFTQYVQLQNEAAKLNNFKNIADWWLSQYELPDFEEQLAKLWEDVKPLYQQLHAYVRKRLRDKYGDQYVSARGPIPAHLLGNIWTATWSNIESFTRPYPDKKEIDITQAMKEQNYTAIKIFQMSEEFFRSLNLTAMPELFWKNSIIEKPDDRDIVCHPSAWDFFDGQDFRIKQCTTIDYEYFQTTHLTMGHIQYYLQYRNQPIIFRDGASPGFHEAVGDTIALSVSSPKHLKRVGLYKGDAEDDQTEINQLYKMAIEKIVSLPFAYSLDLFRYGVFRGTTAPEDYNCHFWHLREMQGVEPPVNRTEDDFDAGAIYVWADVEYVRYFVSFILQFQFHHALCQLAGEYIPGDLTKKLVDCDIYQSVSAGNALANMLKMGSSKPWPDVMEALTGQRAMKADGLLEYFRPLYDWLVTENNRTGEFIGWEPSKIQYCSADQKAALQINEAETKHEPTTTEHET